MDQTKIQVEKRDGSTENFNPEKIERIARAAGLTEEESKKILNAVVSKVKEVADKKENKIKSIEIRKIFLEELKAVNKYAAGLFEWYERTKDGHAKQSN